MTDAGLKKSNYYEQTIRQIDAHHEVGQVPALLSPPGEGKSSLMAEIANRAEALHRGEMVPVAGYYDIRLGAKEPQDFLGTPHRVSVEINGETYTVEDYAAPKWIIEALTAKGIFYVLLDEVYHGRPEVQGAVQDMLLTNTTPGGIKLPDTVRFILAGNPPEEASGTFDMTDAFSARVKFYDFAVPDADWFDGLMTNFGKGGLTELQLRYRTMVVGFLKVHPELIYEDRRANDRTRGWANKRAWTDVADFLAVTHGDLNAQESGVLATVGKSAAVGFIPWLTDDTIPTPDELLTNPSLLDNLDPARAWAALSGLCHVFVARADEERKTGTKADTDELIKVIGVVNYATNDHPEIVISVLHSVLTDMGRLLGLITLKQHLDMTRLEGAFGTLNEM